jgi:GT2 family glycosyltransferase
MPFISLILATVGRTAELDRLFDTLAAQDFHDFEVIVVDQNADNRLDAHVARARSLGISLSHLRHFPANLAAARNAGIAASRGKWLGFPDDDCWYEPSLLQSLATRARASDAPEGVIIRWVEQGEPPVVAPSLSWHRSASFRDVPVSSITLFMQRKLFDRVGGFDARLGVGQWFGAGEETDLVLRALREGATIACEPSARVHHAVAAERPVHTPQTMLAARCRARGTGALYAKHELSTWVIVRGLLAPVLRPVLKGTFGADLAHGRAVMLGRLDGWRGWSRRHR